MQNLATLIYRSKKILQSHIDLEDDTCEINDVSDDNYPFEYFMQIPNRMKRHKFYEDIHIGDVVYGSIARIFPSKLEMYLVCTGGTIVRDVYNLKIPAICLSNELPASSNFSTIQSFRRGDLVKCVIIRIERNETVELSMDTNNSANKLKHLDLGLCAHDKLPKYHKLIRDSNNPPSNFYDVYSKSTLSNSLEIKDKLKFYNLKNPNFSLFDVVNKIEVKSEETAKNLRNSLLMKESKKFVVKGVEYFKQSKYSEALQCYNHALSISDSNVDALVARGALRATLKSFELSITDLEKAVKLEPNHKNAATYLSKAIIAYSKSLPKNEIEKAEKLVKKQLLLEKNMKETSINDISNPNNFIVISDDELLNCSQSSNHKSKEKKKKKHKKQKKSDRKKLKSIDLKSSDLDSYDSKNCESTPKLKHKKSKHSFRKSKKMKRRTASSSQSDNYREHQSNHIDLPNFQSKTNSHRKRKHSSSESDSRNCSTKVIKNQRSVIDYNHKSKTLHDLKSWYSVDDVSNDSRISHSNKYDLNLHSVMNRNNRYCANLKFIDCVNEKSLHKLEYNSDNNYENRRETKTVYPCNSIIKHQFNIIKKDSIKIMNPNRNLSNEMDDIKKEDNRKLKAADEQIKIIEDFITQLRSNKKPF